jgi:serine/threonine protein kinase
MKTILLCPACAAPLPADAPGGLCPRCLLKSGAATEPSRTPNKLPSPGQEFGGYRILRLLGCGGMGSVFEAEQVDSGRRIALKAMNQSLGSEDDRKRFLREGRVAASINHPNVVYVYGSEEVEGTPLIAMELVQGGTLRDRLKKEGKLPVTEAVEAALQIIAGLEAAQSAGVLHRDIKPANCFVGTDGVVKIGDFGLSLSALARGESLVTATGAVLGTPAYASPEQLRGETLDLRADIYSVGATLYHLLTGRLPFQETDVIKLITQVLEKQPEAPQQVRSEIPSELSKIVARCLAKAPSARYQSYDQLREALLPYRNLAQEPAKPRARILAGIIDELIAWAPASIYSIISGSNPLEQLLRERTPGAILTWLPFLIWPAAYYGVLEGLWGAALGKSLCGLRVLTAKGQLMGVGRGVLRWAIFDLPEWLPALGVIALTTAAQYRMDRDYNDWLITDWCWLPLTLLLFFTMRARNGYAALHDLATGSRVVVRPRTQVRPLLRIGGAATEAPGLASESGVRCGPYEVGRELWSRGTERLVAGRDPALRRRIWLHFRGPDAPAVTFERRDLSRPGRLRWLNGGQTAEERWDAYEAPEGTPVTGLHGQAAWGAARFWLCDLAEEILADAKSLETSVQLRFDRVWITASGRAMILDFPAPGLDETFALPGSAQAVECPGFASLSEAEQFVKLQAFLAETAKLTLKSSVAMPVAARRFLDNLEARSFDNGQYISGNLHWLTSQMAEVTPRRRWLSIAAMPAVLAVTMVVAMASMNFDRIRSEREWAKAVPGTPMARGAVKVYLALAQPQKEWAQTFLSRHFGDNPAFLAQTKPSGTLLDVDDQESIRKALAGGKTADAKTIAKAEKEMPLLIRYYDPTLSTGASWAAAIFLTLAIVSAEWAGCLFFGDSFALRLFNIAIVDKKGRPAGRLRLLWRSLLTWAPCGAAIVLTGVAVMAALPVVAYVTESSADFTKITGIIKVAAIGADFCVIGAAIYAACRPTRSLQDLLSGTVLVPR